jgi:protoheme IX farnesyltransferase
MSASMIHRTAVATSPNAPPKAESTVGGIRALAGAYLSLAKPRIIVLLLITTLPAMVLAEGGWPSLSLMIITLVGGTLAAAGANVINCYIDRDIDGVMARTSDRPLPAGLISPRSALTFGVALGAVSFAVLWAGANLLAATLALGALLFYVFVYTIWLKRSSDQNIVIGGAAGAVPPLVGYAAVSGSLDWSAALLFLIIFLWTPPHFWALALRYRGDYARAGVPMLPVVKGESETRRQILLYSVALVVASLLLVPVAGTGVIYALSAAVLGLIFLWYAVRLWVTASSSESRALFFYSLLYLGLLYPAIAVDTLLLG